MSTKTKRYVNLDNADTARSILRKIDWPASYWLGGVSVHVVPETHYLVRHRHLFDESEVVTVAQEDEPHLWRKIADVDQRCGAPPKMAVVVTAPEAGHGSHIEKPFGHLHFPKMQH